MPDPAGPVASRGAAADLRHVLGKPAWLEILMHLYVAEKVDCMYLLRQTALDEASLFAQLKELATAGYVEIASSAGHDRMSPGVRLTTAGRREMDENQPAVADALASLESRRSRAAQGGAA